MTPRQFGLLVALTLVWGLNWPVMKAGVSGLPWAPQSFPPLTFRALSMALGLPLLAAALVAMRVPLAMPRRLWRELGVLTVSNMLVWHVLVIIGVQQLSSGRSAILGYTMPVVAALWGRWIWGERLPAAAWVGVGAAAAGVLLLWGELAAFGGSPWAVFGIVFAAAVWGFGTHRMRKSPIDVPFLTVALWMTLVTTVVMALLALVFEHERWRWPDAVAGGSIVYNAIGVFAFAQVVWLYLARTLPPVAASISVMLIPVLGVFSGALLLGEPLHPQDWGAVVAIVLAIGLVLFGRR